MKIPAPDDHENDIERIARDTCEALFGFREEGHFCREDAVAEVVKALWAGHKALDEGILTQKTFDLGGRRCPTCKR